MLFDHLTPTTAPTSTELTTDIVTQTREAATAEPLIRIRPYPETEGFEAGPRFLRGLHTAPAGTVHRGGAPVYAAEIWFTEGKLQFHLRTPDPEDAIALVTAHYPNSDTEVVTGDGFPDISPGEYAAGCHLELRQDAAFPLKHLDSQPALDTDPYRTLLSRLIGSDDETIFLQVVFMPVGQTWTQRGLLGRFGRGDISGIAHARRQGQVQGYFDPHVVQSKNDTRAADDIAAQVGRPAFTTTIRVLAVAPDASTAEHRLTRVVSAFSALDHEHTKQSLDPVYVPESQLPAVLTAAGMRAHTPTGRVQRLLRGRRNVLTEAELAGLVHLPNGELENATVDWSRTASGVGVPADTDSFSESTSAAQRDRNSAHLQTDRNRMPDGVSQYTHPTSGDDGDGPQADRGGETDV